MEINNFKNNRDKCFLGWREFYLTNKQDFSSFISHRS